MTFWKWLAAVHSSGDEASSKRFYGGIGWIAVIAFAYLVGYKVIPVDVWNDIEGFVTTVTYLATGLLGLDTLKNGIIMLKKDKGNGTNP